MIWHQIISSSDDHQGDTGPRIDGGLLSLMWDVCTPRLTPAEIFALIIMIIGDLMQKRRNSGAFAMELRLFCIKSSICTRWLNYNAFHQVIY